MARLVLAAAADADVQKILYDLYEKAGARVAERYDADFDAIYSRLELLPDMGAK